MKQIPSLLVVAVAAVACSDAFQPTAQNVSGIYELQTFTTDTAGFSKDWVAGGASLELILTPLGDVAGHLTIPGAPTDTSIFIADMIGSWTLTGTTVQFSQQADSFVRDMDWIADKDRLSADKTFGAVRVRVVLKRQPGP